MKLRNILAGVLSAASMLVVASAGAQIVYDNGTPSTSNGFHLGGTIGGSGYTTADDFTLGSSATVNGVGFYFQNYSGITGWDGNISYAIRGDSSNSPGSILASGSGSSVTSSLSSYPWCCGGGNAWLVTFNLASGFAAAGGTKYWLELGGAGGDTPWWVTSSAFTGASSVTMSGGAVQIEWGEDVAFYLSGTAVNPVPEPETYAMLTAGLGLLVFAARRRNRKVS